MDGFCLFRSLEVGLGCGFGVLWVWVLYGLVRVLLIGGGVWFLIFVL